MASCIAASEIVLRIVQLGSQDPERVILASHVCSRWRKLVVRRPSLWMDVYIRNIPSKKLNIAHASTVLARSGQLPLDITVEVKPGFLGGKWASVTSAVTGLIAPHIHQMRKFHLTYAELFRVKDVMGMIPRSPAPILEMLSPVLPSHLGWIRTPLVLPCLQPPAHEEPSSSEESAALFPGLRDLCFSGTAPRWSTFAPRNLRSLELNNPRSSMPPGLNCVQRCKQPYPL